MLVRAFASENTFFHTRALWGVRKFFLFTEVAYQFENQTRHNNEHTALELCSTNDELN